MLLLSIFIILAIGVSFLCSIAESVLLSVTHTYTIMLEKQGRKSGKILSELKDEVDKPLAAILTLNTIAHTVGAAGAGAQAQVVFGDQFFALFSAILTFLILFFSEIIPKTLGAHYWQQLAPATAIFLKYLILLLLPFVKLSELITRRLGNKEITRGFSHEEFSVMADVSLSEGKIRENESKILKNMVLMHNTAVTDGMTPNTVIFSLCDTVTVEEYFHKYDKMPFSRIPVYQNKPDDIVGYVFRSDLLLAQARGNGQQNLKNYVQKLPSIPVNTSMSHAFNLFLQQRTHMMLVVTEYGVVKGLITLEDCIETLIGLEIIDEKDIAINMRKEARKLWQRRAEAMGINLQEFDKDKKNDTPKE